mmetsp:Transcript_55800/g.130243  ORF Transcript_55800/g.130243 Transcript_55800/m.130243 type:complete len:351 (+) Transcript_55800:742-1794(+)
MAAALLDANGLEEGKVHATILLCTIFPATLQGRQGHGHVRHVQRLEGHLFLSTLHLAWHGRWGCRRCERGCRCCRGRCYFPNHRLPRRDVYFQLCQSLIEASLQRGSAPTEVRCPVHIVTTQVHTRKTRVLGSSTGQELQHMRRAFPGGHKSQPFISKWCHRRVRRSFACAQIQAATIRDGVAFAFWLGHVLICRRAQHICRAPGLGRRCRPVSCAWNPTYVASSVEAPRTVWPVPFWQWLTSPASAFRERAGAAEKRRIDQTMILQSARHAERIRNHLYPSFVRTWITTTVPKRKSQVSLFATIQKGFATLRLTACLASRMYVELSTRLDFLNLTVQCELSLVLAVRTI